MARQVLPIVGAVVGAFFGSPQLGYAIGAIIGNAVDPQVISGPKIGEAGLQTSAEGMFRPIVFGTAAIKGNVIVRGNRQVKTQRTQQGKGGGPVVEEQRVYWTFAIRLGEPLAGILRIWQDEKLVYDVRPESVIPEESAEYAERFRFYDGSETQLPDPDLEAFQGIGNTSAYRGTSYVVFPNFDLTDRRESIPDFRFEVGSTLVGLDSQLIALRVSTNNDDFIVIDTDWTGSWVNDPDLTSSTQYALQSGTRVIAYGNPALANNPRYTDDLGDNWPASTGAQILASGGVRAGWAMNGRVMIPGGVQDIIYSSDNSSSYVVLTGSPNSNAIAGIGGRWISLYSGTGELSYSADNGETWIPGASTGLGITAQPCRWSDGSTAMFGGVFGFPHTPGLVSTTDGVVSVNQVLPAFVSATQITALHEHNGTWVLGTDSGEFAYRPPGGVWTLSADTMGVWVRDMAHNGSEFVAIGGYEVDGETDGFIKSSVDGNIWTTRFTEPLGNNDRWSAIVQATPAQTQIGSPVPLSSIVAYLHERAGHDSSDYNVSELVDMVDGIVFAEGYTCADAIRTLLPVYFSDASEHDTGTGYRVHYIKRGKPVVAVITDDDIIQAPEKSVREDALERPRKLHLHYQSPTIGYAPAKATSRRDSPDILVVGEVSVQVPVSFSDVDEPAQISDKLMKISWVEVAGEEEFVLGDDWLELVPTDCIGVSLRGQTRRLRINQELVEPGCQPYRMIADRQSAVTSNVTGIPLPEPTPPLPSIVGQTIYNTLDIPALNDNNDRLGWYDAASGQTQAWYGAQTQHKAGASVEFENSARFTQNTIMGVLVDDLAAASEHYPDTTNVVRVQLYTDDVLESLTDAQFLSEGGSFALENGDGTWEILQYRDAEQESNGTFSLSMLLRGRLNTGGSAHVMGDRFVLLDGVQMVDAVTAWIDTDIVHRAISFGLSPDGVPQTTEEWTAKIQTEFPVAHLFLSRNVDAISAMTVPRHRFGTEDNPIQSVNWIGYRWTATDGVNTATIPDGTSPTMSFDAAGWSSPITVTVAQINRFTGPGPAVSEDIA